MEKVKVNIGYKRIRDILNKKGYKKAKDYLQGEGFMFFKDLGWIKQARTDECINKGLIKFNYENDLLITTEGCNTNVFSFLGGYQNKIKIGEGKKGGGGIFG